MNPQDVFQPAPAIRPMLNVGCLLDIPTGRYYLGKHGESILNGGMPYITGVVGRGNTYKSVIKFFMTLRVLDRYRASVAAVYDTESTATVERMMDIASRMPNIGGVDLTEEMRLLITDKTKYTGTEWFDRLREYLNYRIDNIKQFLRTTPFRDKKGNQIIGHVPYLVDIDSLSMFVADVVIKMQEGGVGASDRNTEAMRDAASKTQLLMEMPTLTAKSGCYFGMTGHVGDSIQMDQYAPNPKKLGFMKNNQKIKNIPEKVSFLMNNLWQTTGAAPMINQTTKAPEYPRGSDDDLKGDTDLMCVTIMNLRGKSGPTGMPFEILCSQSEGVLVGLSEFHYCKEMDRYGIGGNVQNYFMDLLPDIKLSRTTVRGKIRDNVQLQRVMEITSEMCQMNNLWHHMPAGVMCTPKELYEDLKAKGYDWNRLLDTRGYWVFEEDEANEKPFLSSMDLLNMRVGTYHPWWYGPLEKK
jgi:hypothetical protein